MHSPIERYALQHKINIKNLKPHLLTIRPGNGAGLYSKEKISGEEISKEKLLQPFNGLFSRTTWVSQYQKGKTNLDFTGARDSELQWHQLGHMQACTSPQTDNHASTPPLSFLQAGCPSCRPTNSVKALKAFK